MNIINLATNRGLSIHPVKPAAKSRCVTVGPKWPAQTLSRSRLGKNSFPAATLVRPRRMKSAFWSRMTSTLYGTN
jgi:hypothetical protein